MVHNKYSVNNQNDADSIINFSKDVHTFSHTIFLLQPSIAACIGKS
jgi:hypothetical protein